MSENNEEILLNFQFITNIEDLGEAIMHLEACNWDLYAAVRRAIPQDNDQQAYSGFNVVPNHDIVEGLNNLDGVSSVDEMMTAPSSPARATYRNIFGPDMSSASAAIANTAPIDLVNDYNNGSSSSSSGGGGVGVSAATSNSGNIRHKAKDIIFNIHHLYNMHRISISNQATVGELKAKIMDQTSIPVCRQTLKGWLPAHQNVTNNTVLHTLNVARENELLLTDQAEDGFSVADVTARRLTQTFTLNIKWMPDGTDISLNFPGLQRYIDIKTDVYTITDIPVRHQTWTGWPPNMTNDTTLAASGIDAVHSLQLKSSSVTSSGVSGGAGSSSFGNHLGVGGTASTRSSSSNIIEIDSDEYEDATDADFNADEDLFTEPIVPNRVNYLIADDMNDEKEGSRQFVENYIKRYGDPHPEFFTGSLEDALAAACQKPAKERKMLAIYLHHDGSVLTNVFCDQLLKCDSIKQMLQHNFVLYGWDLTYESNKNMFLSSISVCVGMTATITVRNLQVPQLPAILVIGKSRSTCEVLSMIHGNVSKDELMNKLIDTFNMYSEQRHIEVREENERADREMVKFEQDVAYNESLEADRRKEEAKRQKEHAIATERKRLESERQEIEAVREAKRREAEQSVPVEPPVGATGCTKIRIRTPAGTFFERRFSVESKLLGLLHFVASKGFPIDEYKVISTFPRRDLTTIDADKTLGNYNLCPQETVILEER